MNNLENTSRCENCKRIFKTPHYFSTITTTTDGVNERGEHQQTIQTRVECEYCRTGMEGNYSEALRNIFTFKKGAELVDAVATIEIHDNRYNKTYPLGWVELDEKGELVGAKIAGNPTATGTTEGNRFVGDIFLRAVIDFTEQAE